MQFTPFYSGRAYYELTADDGQKYVYAPQEFIQKGFVQGNTQFYDPDFMNQGSGLFSTAKTYTLPSEFSVNDTAKALYKNPNQGYVWKEEDYLKNADPGYYFNYYDITSSHPAIRGFGKMGGSYVYATDTEPGWDSTYISKANADTGVTSFTANKAGRSILGDLFGGLGDSLSSAINSGLAGINELGPLGTAAISAINPLAGAAVAGANAGNALATGADLGQAATGLGAAYLGSEVGSSVGGATGSAAAGSAAGATTSGLLQGQNLETALTNGALAGAGTGIAGAVNTPTEINQQPDFKADYSAPSTGGGLGLQASQGTGLDLYGGSSGGSNLTDMGGAQGLSAGNTLFGAANLSNMGGGQGVTIPSSTGLGTLGETGVGNAWVNSPLELNSQMAEQPSTIGAAGNNVISGNTATSLLKALFGGSLVGKSNMADTATAVSSNNVGNTLAGLLGGAGGLMQGASNTAALKGYAGAITQAGQQAQAQSAFRPVGVTTNFGTSNFQVDPTTGQITSAGYSLSPQMQGVQNALMGQTGQSAQDASTVSALGRSYLAQNPQEVAQNWLSKQQALLAPSREQAWAQLNQGNYNQGTTGLKTAQGGSLQAANPYASALANAQAQQDAALAAQAQQQGQQGITFGQGLLSSAYNPVQQGLTTAGALESLGQQPLGLSTQLANLASQAGSRTGAIGVNAATQAGGLMAKANQDNPYASILSGIGTSSTAGNVLGGLFGNTGLGNALGSSLGSWLGGLGSNLSMDQLNSLLGSNSNMAALPNYLDSAGQLSTPDMSGWDAYLRQLQNNG